MTETTADVEGPDWSARAGAWAELWAHLADPARAAVAEAAGIGAGTRVLDIGCGSGEFLALAAGRGAEVSGIDAAEGMIELARGRLPSADLRVGPMERLPWADGSFDLACGFNAFQFAADVAAAIAEAGRVAPRVAICSWATQREALDALEPLHALLPPEPPGPPRPRVGDPGVIERLAREAGLRPGPAAEVDVPYEVPDEETLVRALLFDVAALGEDVVRRVGVPAAERYRRPDGSYRFENRFRYLIAERPAS
jgi:SAM-dependent methyltransferase